MEQELAAAYRLLIAQMVREIGAWLDVKDASADLECRLKKLEAAIAAARDLTRVLEPLAHASASDFAGFDWASYWPAFDRALLYPEQLASWID